MVTKKSLEQRIVALEKHLEELTTLERRFEEHMDVEKGKTAPTAEDIQHEWFNGAEK